MYIEMVYKLTIPYAKKIIWQKRHQRHHNLNSNSHVFLTLHNSSSSSSSSKRWSPILLLESFQETDENKMKKGGHHFSLYGKNYNNWKYF